jgi:rare lipoprotein A
MADDDTSTVIEKCSVMSINSRCSNLAAMAAITLIQATSFGIIARAATAQNSVVQESAKPARLTVESKPDLDRSGKRRIGKASFYAHQFAGRKMANGNRMDPAQNNAASRTLPLGTIAKVTNLKTGQSAVVTIEDRGPYVSGRIVDLSPATAQQIGITRREGITKVEVAPISVPQPDGRLKLGAAADDIVIARNVELMQFGVFRP